MFVYIILRWWWVHLIRWWGLLQHPFSQVPTGHERNECEKNRMGGGGCWQAGSRSSVLYLAVVGSSALPPQVDDSSRTKFGSLETIFRAFSLFTPIVLELGKGKRRRLKRWDERHSPAAKSLSQSHNIVTSDLSLYSGVSHRDLVVVTSPSPPFYTQRIGRIQNTFKHTDYGEIEWR